jgi:hypothetical protein
MSGPGHPFTLVRNPGQPVLTGRADRDLEVLMRLAVEEIRACREAIGEAGPEAPGDLGDCLASLALLEHAIRACAMVQAFGEMDGPPVPSRRRTRHLAAAVTPGDAL